MICVFKSSSMEKQNEDEGRVLYLFVLAIVKPRYMKYQTRYICRCAELKWSPDLEWRGPC